MTPDEFAPLGMNDDEAARAHAAIRKLTKECRDVTTLYLAGTSVLIFSEGWLTWRPGYRGSLAASVVAVAAMPAAFVLWQFEMRLFAVRMVGACTNVAARWVTAQLPLPSNSKPTRLRNSSDHEPWSMNSDDDPRLSCCRGGCRSS